MTDTRECTRTQNLTNAVSVPKHLLKPAKRQFMRGYILAPSPTPVPSAARASELPLRGEYIKDLIQRY